MKKLSDAELKSIEGGKKTAAKKKSSSKTFSGSGHTYIDQPDFFGSGSTSIGGGTKKAVTPKQKANAKRSAKNSNKKKFSGSGSTKI